MTKLTVLFSTERLLPIMAAPTSVFPMHIGFLVQTRRCQARFQDLKSLRVAETTIRPFHVDVRSMAKCDHSRAPLTLWEDYVVGQSELLQAAIDPQGFFIC